MTWLRRLRGAIGTGITWAVVWAPIAVIVGTQLIDPTDKMDEMWWMVGAMPGLIAGIIFSVALGVSARNRRLRDLSVARVGGWGALAGLATGILPFMLGDRGGEPMLPLAMIVIPTLTLMSGLSAAASLALAQRVVRSESDVADSNTRHNRYSNDIPSGHSLENSLHLKSPTFDTDHLDPPAKVRERDKPLR